MKTSDDPKTSGTTFDVKQLTRVYGEGPAAVHALRGVDLQIPKGDLVVLLGASGSGKSTLLNILGGLDRATDGQAHFFDKDLTAMSDAQLTRYRRHHVGFVFQFYNLMPSLTAHENVDLVTEISDNPMPADEALDLVGLSHRQDHFPAEMSGGATAAGRDCAGDCQAPHRPFLRRAHRRAGFNNRPPGSEGDPGCECQSRDHGHDRNPCRGHGSDGAPGHPHG